MSEIEKDLASENQRLRERVAELEADASASSAEDERGHALIDDADGEDERTTSMSTLAERVEALLDQREAVREYLADHGGEPYRAPSPPDILRRVAERVLDECAWEATAFPDGADVAVRLRRLDIDAIIKEATRD